jgi:hypothetical protein
MNKVQSLFLLIIIDAIVLVYCFKATITLLILPDKLVTWLFDKVFKTLDMGSTTMVVAAAEAASHKTSLIVLLIVNILVIVFKLLASKGRKRSKSNGTKQLLTTVNNAQTTSVEPDLAERNKDLNVF